MKQQSSSSPRHADFPMSNQEANIVSAALDFVMCADNYTSVDPTFCHENSFNAADKIDASIFSFTRKEIRSISFAINYSLQHMGDSPDAIAHVEEEFPGIITDLRESVPLLESLKIRLAAVSAKMARRKRYSFESYISPCDIVLLPLVPPSYSCQKHECDGSFFQCFFVLICSPSGSSPLFYPLV